MSRIKDVRILIVDDNPINRSFLRQVLEREQAHTEETATGEQALEQCRQQRFDLILLDIRMPGIGGLEVAKHLRNKPGPNQRTPIIILTADMSTIGLQEDLPSNLVQAWMLKPVSSMVLMKHIHKLLNKEDAPQKPLLPSDSKAPIHLEHAGRMVNNDWAITAELLAMMRDQLPQRIQELLRLDADGDIQQVKELVHGLYGSAGYCGALRLQEQALLVENLIEQGKPYDEPLMALRKEALHVTSWITENLHKVEERAGSDS